MIVFNKISLICSLLLLSASFANAENSNVDGDKKALDQMALMFQKLGGREVWANAKSIYTVERVRHYKYGDGIIETVWRDLENPGASIKLMHPNLNLIYAWNSKFGWVSRKGSLRDLSDDEISQKEIHWHRDLYTLLHQLALGERKLSLKALKPYGFKVLDEDKKKIGEFRLTPGGELSQWQRFGGQESVTYIYGPYKSFGLVNFPDWSTTSDGHWGSYIVQLQPNNLPFEANVSLEKPLSDCTESDWQGGAVNSKCIPKKP
ncbi:MAG: hypothetical protein ACI9FB_002813 [Candidatus Azotimanducaceae bacterium]|jgi:hypothetical protein